MRNLNFFQVIGLSAVAAIVACSSYGKDGAIEHGNAAATGDPSSATTTLNTRISQNLEIDMVTSGPDDANLTRGVAGEPDYQKPGANSSWIDWTDLGSDAQNHLLKDLNGAKGRDPSSFPRSVACVGASQVLSKMDLTYVAAANNNTYAYFAVQRSDNNGDAGYYWVFTKKAPRMKAGEAPCQADEQHLVYDITAGDVLIGGHFSGSGGALVKVWKANKDEASVDAVSAIDFTNARWTDGSSAVAAAAINTTPTPPGSFGSDGVGALKNGNLDVNVFAEAAIDLSVFTGGANNCGATYYGSVITRSSGSGGTTPDLKDLAGPALFNFGTASASAQVTGGCTGKLHLVGGGTGPDGQPMNNPTCSWSISDGSTVVQSGISGCDTYSDTLPGGKSYTATLTINDPVCGATQAAGSATVYDGLGVTISANNTSLSCGDAITYTAHATGGTGTYTYSWGAASGCSANSATCIVDPADSVACADNTFNVTVNDGTCPGASSKNATYKKVTTVTASVEQ